MGLQCSIEMEFKRKRAFALVMVLLLIGFLVGLIFTASILLKIDYQLKDNISAIREAKDNARIALKIALGELQDRLGPDLVNTDLDDSSWMNVCSENYGYSIEDLNSSENFKEGLGVLINPRLGGLKKNLSAYLSRDLNVHNDRGTPIFEDPENNTKYVPNWEFVRSFYQLARLYKEENKRALNPQAVLKTSLFNPYAIKRGKEAQAPLVHGIGPVIVGCSFGFRPIPVLDESENSTNEMKIKYFVTVALWNPYDFSLNESEYYFRIDIPDQGHPDSLIIKVGHQTLSRSFYFKGALRYGFEPGETAVFSLYDEEDNLGNEPYLRLSNTVGLSLGRVMHIGKFTGVNRRAERGWGNSQNNNNGFEYEISWGMKAGLFFSLSLLSKSANYIYQEIQSLRLSEDGGPLHQGINSKIGETESNDPLFAIVYKDLKTGDTWNNHLKNYNPRAFIISPTEQDLKDKRLPYELKNFVYATNSDKSWVIKKSDFKNYRSIFSMPKDLNSLGFLKHVNFGPLGSNSSFLFGNSFKNDEDYSYRLNEELWDNHFLFQGKENLNQYVILKEVENHGAENLLIKGSFNINSISLEAWKRLLNVLNREPLLLSKNSIDRLAIAIVEEIKQNGPFKSIGQFVNEGIIQMALNKVSINAMQPEILELIGDKLSIRSDTFKIHAYGESNNKLCTKISCEAYIQRVPEYIENEENTPRDLLEELSEVNKKLGRRFKIISFRWLE